MAGFKFVNAPNRVPEHQKNYQAAYRAHTRIWRIGSRSSIMYIPFLITMWGTTAVTFYGMGRKVLGYNSYW